MQDGLQANNNGGGSDAISSITMDHKPVVAQQQQQDASGQDGPPCDENTEVAVNTIKRHCLVTQKQTDKLTVSPSVNWIGMCRRPVANSLLQDYPLSRTRCIPVAPNTWYHQQRMTRTSFEAFSRPFLYPSGFSLP